MGDQDTVKRRQLGLSVMVLLLFLGNVVNCQLGYQYSADDLNALQTIWGEWNKSTRNLDQNLAGWNSSQQDPCPSLSETATIPNWRGVQCLKIYYNATANADMVRIVGLSISNASIVGVLPRAIGNMTKLISLELTGNPELTGPLPQSLERTWLNTLDVHDNGFAGTIPSFLLLFNLLNLDLSGNKFTGEYPFRQLSTMDYLQTLKIGNNRLRGQIQTDAYTNKADLEKLDISNNFFNGTLPNLNPMTKLTNLDVSGNQFEGPLPDLTQLISTLQIVNLSRNRFTATSLDYTLNLMIASTSLIMVDLSNNELTGPLPPWNTSIQQVGTLQELYLDNNSISGTLDITQMFALGLLQDKKSASNSTSGLKILSLSNNSIQHVVYDPYIITNISTLFNLDGNPYCNNYDSNDDGQRCFCTQICFVTTTQVDKRKIVIIAATSSVAAVVLILLVVVGAILLKNRRYKQYLQLQFERKFEEFDVKPTIYPYNELRAATRDFHEDTKLGQGGYGAVYKGVLPNGHVVAVKQLYVKGSQGMDEFLNEVVLITGMKHRNLVNLKGCCLREHQRLLVYEYVDNYDVDQVLLGARREAVSWPVRQKICLGIARGLHYLHALAHPRVIHRDIKAGNVLLDRNLEPKIADFGLALLFPDKESHITTVHVAGTMGYLAPEYASLGQLSDKVDVYSFGVLCLEIISGRRNIDESMPLHQVYLSKWAWQLQEEDRLMELVDPTLHLTDEEMVEVQRVINTSLLCIQIAAERRPSMARIVSILQSDTESEVIVISERNGRRSFQSVLSHKSVDGGSSGLESVMEEGCSSNGYQGKSLESDDVALMMSGATVELAEIRAR